MALASAAAIVLDEARNKIPPAEFPDDRSDALNIAAGALARLVTVYASDGAHGVHSPVALDFPLKGRFMNGGTALRQDGGHGATITSLWVRRTDLAFALLLMRRAGLPFALAMNFGESDAPGT